MSISVHKEPKDLIESKTTETCMFCHTPTRYWANPHVPCCPSCSVKVEQKDIDKHTPFRLLLEAVIISRYKSVFHGLDEVSTKGYKGWDWLKQIPTAFTREESEGEWALYNALQKGAITIEQYLNELTDYQVIVAFQSQCCLEYR